MSRILDHLAHLFHELTSYRFCTWMKKSKDYDLECERCYSRDYILYKSYKDSEGMDYIYEDSNEPLPKERRVPVWVCRRCENELMNGGGMGEDPVDLELQREIEDYEYDPINNDPPEGWGEWQ